MSRPADGPPGPGLAGGATGLPGPGRAGPLGGLCPQPQWCSLGDPGPAPAVPDHPEAYRIGVRHGDVSVEAATPVGAFRAASTIDQLRMLFADGIPDLEVIDWPNLDHRGVMLDVSRDCLPTVATLQATLDRLAGLKVNHVELYLEAHFDHPGHRDTTGSNHPYTAADIAGLRDFAAQRHIELVGQQNCLGHMERWLDNPRHAHLAALPGGYRTPDGQGHEPPACVDPASEDAWELASELVSNVAEAFDAPWVHLGLDEPLDLDPALWDAIFDVGDGPAPWASVDNGAFCVPLPAGRRAQYVQWVRRLHQLPALRGRRLLMWADVVAPHPELAGELPADIVLVEWGYEADHPFDARCARLADAGRTFWAAPGTAGWTAVGGRIGTMVANVTAAVDAVATHGGEGLLVTRWETLPEIADWPGFVWGAALAWNHHRPPVLADALDVAVARGHGLGAVWETVGTIDDGLPAIPERGSVSEMFRSGGLAGVGLSLFGMTADDLAVAAQRLAAARSAVSAATVAAPDGELLRRELAWVVDALAWGVAAARHRLGWPGDPGSDRLRLAHAALVDEHARVWHARHRPAGADRVAAHVAETVGDI
jgi:hexosaminidase